MSVCLYVCLCMILAPTGLAYTHRVMIQWVFASSPGVTFRTLTRCDFGHSIGAMSLATQLSYADIVNIMEVYIPRNNLQLE